MHLGRYLLIGAGLIVVVIGGLVLRTLNAAGAFSDVTTVALATCKTLGDLTGSEDVQVDRKTKTLFVSSADFRASAKGSSSSKDGIYALSPDHPEQGLHKLVGTPPDFHPHGLSLYRAPDGVLILMAVNHPAGFKPSTIEIFEVTESDTGPTLNHVGSVKGDLLNSPNDVVAVGKDRFYATNDHGDRTGIMRSLEDYLMLPHANVVYYDGGAFHVVAEGLHFANGIAISPDLSLIYVAETTGGEIKTYARDVMGGDLTLKNTFAPVRGPDNIDVDEAGNLWIAGHPKLLKMVARGGDPTALSPSQITKITVVKGLPASATTVYANLGEQVSGSSSGVTFANHLYIGSVFGPGILDCALTK